MNAGQLRERITIEQSRTAPDALGYPVETWSTLATVWADVRELVGAERDQNDRATQTKRVSIRIRYRDDVTVKHRIKARGVTFQIETIVRVDTSRRMEMLEIGARYDA